MRINNPVTKHRTDDWKISVKRVTEDEYPILSNLLQLHEYEGTWHTGNDTQDNGLFINPIHKEEYFHYHFIYVNDNLAGYVLTEHHGYHIFETLFIVLKYQNEEIEEDVAGILARMYPGQWKIFSWPMSDTEQEDMWVRFLKREVGETYSHSLDTDCNMAVMYFHTDDFINP